jgi:hypothetical protein
MSGERMRFWIAVVCIGGMMLAANALWAQDAGPSGARLKAVYGSLLSALDANKDGKLSMSECMAMSKDKQTAEKDCKYWDANNDGIITEAEYVSQARKIMR